ncbi:hypothetical protein A2Y68_00340 [Candidatus Woesebacteria bacterium RBG_13_46_13]|uniref:Glycosyltransferase RgtA/B/C/D-like domain-containing protein n=1 Tax=Candidatus Woesebacteria bacterium RBG_13_46_13 TaxID=1802479 RepID=A0A1F7X337_9BACT|nr:MAG: hypothetical protein A2Y68_00340 [Candidatus Woesebacteria bacterium RBG_13_46_13]
MQGAYFILNLLLFVGTSFVFFVIPGVYILAIAFPKLSPWEKFIYGTVVGLVLFTLVSYLLLLINFPLAIFVVYAIFDLVAAKQTLALFKQLTLPSKKWGMVIVLVFALGILGQLLVIAPSGTFVEGALVFWGSHAHDASWHIALMNEMNKGFPLQNPVFAGERLINYHFFSDVAPAIFNKFLKLPALDLYFRFFPLLESLLLGASAYFLTKKLGKSTLAGIWGVIFVYFGGSFGYMVTLLQGRGVGGESLFWATQIQSSIANPPQIISDFLVLTVLFLLISFLAKPKLLPGIVIALAVGVLATFKVYAAIPVLGALAIASVWRLAREKKIDLFAVTLTAGALTAGLYLPNTKASTAFLIFQPWWFVRTMVVEPSRLNWIDLELRRQFYLDRGGVRSILRIIEYESVALIIFFFGNLGTRALGFWQAIGSAKNYFSDYFSQIFASIMIISFILPLLFLQKGVAGNTAQFLQYFLLLFGISAAIAISKFLGKIKNPILGLAISLAIIALSAPTQMAQIVDFYKRAPFAKISPEELSALSLIKKDFKSDTVVMTPPYNQYVDLKTAIPDIWDWSDSGYVSAFSGKETYISDIEQVDVMGYDYKERLSFQEKIFLEPSAQVLAEKLKEKGISVLYFPQQLKPKADYDTKFFDKIVENRKVEVWIVK